MYMLREVTNLKMSSKQIQETNWEDLLNEIDTALEQAPRLAKKKSDLPNLKQGIQFLGEAIENEKPYLDYVHGFRLAKDQNSTQLDKLLPYDVREFADVLENEEKSPNSLDVDNRKLDRTVDLMLDRNGIEVAEYIKDSLDEETYEELYGGRGVEEMDLGEVLSMDVDETTWPERLTPITLIYGEMARRRGRKTRAKESTWKEFEEQGANNILDNLGYHKVNGVSVPKEDEKTGKLVLNLLSEEAREKVETIPVQNNRESQKPQEKQKKPNKTTKEKQKDDTRTVTETHLLIDKDAVPNESSELQSFYKAGAQFNMSEEHSYSLNPDILRQTVELVRSEYEGFDPEISLGSIKGEEYFKHVKNAVEDMYESGALKEELGTGNIQGINRLLAGVNYTERKGASYEDFEREIR